MNNMYRSHLVRSPCVRRCSVSYLNCSSSYYGPPVVQRTDFLNGIKVAATRHLGSPIGACTIMFQVGSRHETYEQRGASHYLRTMSASSGLAYSQFAKMRHIQKCGAAITATGDRQSVAFTLRCKPVDFPKLKNYLLDAALRCCYHEWELNDLKLFIRGSLSRISAQERVIDLVQRALWFGPLGNSVYCDEGRLEEMSSCVLREFYRNFDCENCSVASVGFPYEETLKLAQGIEFTHEKLCADCTVSVPKRGYEYYDLGKSSDTWIAVAVPGCGTCNFGDLLNHSILAAACGAGNAQTGQHSFDRMVHKPLGLLAKDVQTDLKAFSISYLECGVFGVVAKTRACTAENVTKGIIKFLSNVDKLSTDDIEVGKKRLKLGLALHEEDCVQVAEGLALQIANCANVDGPHESFAVVDAVCNQDVLETAKEIAKRKTEMAIAVVGDITAVPPDVDLFKGIR